MSILLLLLKSVINASKWLIGVGMIVLLTSLCRAAPIMETSQVDSNGFFFPISAPQASFVFSGMVNNENGEFYTYFFQIQRQEQMFHAKVALFDAQHQQPIFKEESHAQIEHPDDYDWKIGRAFLRFNAINDSWVFGLLDAHHQGGFNFKVDMLNQREHHKVTRYSRHGISFIVMQTGALDGHVQLSPDETQFVMSKTTWFRQIWLTQPAISVESHQLDGLLCRFQDGRGLYSIRLSAASVTRGAVSGLLSEEGQPSAISQFIHVEEKPDHAWLVRVPSPAMQLQISPSLQENAMIAGFMMDKEHPGFCLLSRDEMGLAEVVPPINMPKASRLVKSSVTPDNLPMCTHLWC